MDGISLDDLLRQIRMTRRLGPFAWILRLSPEYVRLEPDRRMHRRMEAMISAMTPGERRSPETVGDGKRIAGISRECGEPKSDVLEFLRRFGVMRELHGAG